MSHICPIYASYLKRYGTSMEHVWSMSGTFRGKLKIYMWSARFCSTSIRFIALFPIARTTMSFSIDVWEKMSLYTSQNTRSSSFSNQFLSSVFRSFPNQWAFMYLSLLALFELRSQLTQYFIEVNSFAQYRFK